MQKYRYEEIAEELESNILEGRLKPGHQLPSVRALKLKYNIGLSTVKNVYEYLMIKGLAESIPKSGYYVTAAGNDAGKLPETKKRQARIVVHDAVFKNNLAVITTHADPQKKHSITEFNVAAPGDFFIPQKLLLRTMQQVIREKGVGLLKYYPSNGSEHLKEHLAKRATLYHSRFNADEMIITDGAIQAFYIALAAVTAPGDVIAIESPCIFSVLEVVKNLRLKVVEIPVHAGTGFDVAFLKRAAQQTALKAIILTPNFHNPTGALLADADKKQLLTIAQSRGIPIIENDVLGDLHFSGNRPLNIQSMDNSGLVMTFSSFSKTLAPGIRLGWLSAGKFFKQAEQLKFSLGSTVSPVYQETIVKLLASSSYDRHIRKFRMQLAAQAYHTANLITEFFPESTRISQPKGGYSTWLKMEKKLNMKLFYKTCEQHGIRFTPGSTFSFSDVFEQHFRIIFANKYTAQREEMLKLAGKIAQDCIL